MHTIVLYSVLWGMDMLWLEIGLMMLEDVRKNMDIAFLREEISETS